MDNIKIGNKTEKTVSSVFREKGYWVYNCPKSSTGAQPFDLIAIRGCDCGHIVWFVDGKHVRENEVSFKLERIEPNQIISMEYARDFAKINVANMGFAIEFERTNNFYWLSYEMALECLKNNEKSVNLNRLTLLEEVLNLYEHDNKQ